MFGLATSLGLGVKQVTTGLNYLFGIPANSITMVVLIVVITGIAMASVLTGINVGIKRLSQFNVILAFVVAVGGYHTRPDALHCPHYLRWAW